MKKLKAVPRVLKVKVCIKDISAAIDSYNYGDGSYCPIARAMKRMYGDRPNADYDRLQLTINGQRAVYNPPQSATRFMKKFDTKRLVKPFLFNAKLSSFDANN